MFAKRSKGFAAAALVTVLVLGGLALAARTGQDTIRASLPDPPFAKAPDGFPRIIPVREVPDLNGKVALEAYRAERKAVWRFLTEDGAIRHARPEERDAVAAALDGRFAKARTLALKVLNADSRSVPALYALAYARVEGDANLPDGLFLLRRVRRLVERLGRANPRDVDALEWYLRVLYLEYDVLVDLGRAEESLRAVELMERVYAPLPALKVWSDFKLGRLDEAETAIEQEQRSGHWRRRAANDRLALEGLRHHREKAFEAGRTATAVAQGSPVIWSNQAGAAWACFRFDEAEAAFRRSAALCDELGAPDFAGSPLTFLARLCAQEGRAADALDALRKARIHRARRLSSTLQNDQAEFDETVALTLLSLGRVEDAERFARRAFDTPDRLGRSSARRDEKTLGGAIVLWTVLTAARERIGERAAVRGESDWWGPAANDAIRWRLARQAAHLARDSSRPSILRPFVPGSTAVESWQLGSILRMVPPGAALAMVSQARREEDHPTAPPYFDALEAEARLLAGDAEGAFRLGAQALARLPRSGEALLRGRTAAIAAEAARRLARYDEARRLWSQALAECPAAPLLLGLSLPVHVETDGSPSARALAERLLRSPRFRSESWGLPLSINSGSVALTRADGSAHVAVALAPGQTTDHSALTDACDRFHQQLTGPSVPLTAVDVNALDGVPGAAANRADEQALTDARPAGR
jgi:tetratricopeptide (TPR) repeat protein